MKKCLFVRWKSLISVMLCTVLLLALIPASPISAEGGIVPEGVYLMENVSVIDNHSSYGSFYLQASSADAGAALTVRTDELGDLEDNLYRYWYFEHLGSNEYVIRSMAKQSMVLTVNETGDGVTLSEEGASLASSSIWMISGSVGWCIIKNSLYPTKSLMCPPSNVSHGSNFYYLPARVSTYQGMTIDYWKLTDCNDLESKGIDDKTEYFIMNYANKKYMSLGQMSTENGTSIKTVVYNTSAIMKWKPVAQKDLSYQLINMYSGSKVLNASGTSLSLYTDTNAAGQMFEIERIDSGTYQGLYYIRYEDYYVTASAASAGSVYLTTTPTQYSIWSFKKVAKGTAHLYNFIYTYMEDEETYIFDTTANQDTFVGAFNDLDYTASYYTSCPTCTTCTTCASSRVGLAINSLKYGDVFVYRGHAGPGRLYFRKTGNVDTGRIYAHILNYVNQNNYEKYFISDLEDNALASQRCVLLLGCRSGLTTDDGYNLVDAIYEKGAHFVLGTTQTTYPEDSDNFLMGFIEELSIGGSIKECIDKGLIKAGEKNRYKDDNNPKGYYPIIYVGDTFQYLN